MPSSISNSRHPAFTYAKILFAICASLTISFELLSDDLLKHHSDGRRPRSILMDIGAQGIDRAHIVAAGEQLARDMLADKARRSGQQHPHRR